MVIEEKIQLVRKLSDMSYKKRCVYITAKIHTDNLGVYNHIDAFLFSCKELKLDTRGDWLAW